MSDLEITAHRSMLTLASGLSCAIAVIGAVVARLAWVAGLKFECGIVGFVAASLLVFAIWLDVMERKWAKLAREGEGE